MKNRELIFLLSIFLVYTALALVFSSSQGFWHDEIYTLTFLKGISAYDFMGSTLTGINHEFNIQYCKELLQKDNYISNFSIQILHEGHPPLYFIFLKLWSLIFGFSELALRSFSLLSGLLSIGVLYTVYKDNFKNSFIALIIVLLIIFNPYLFYYFTEARMYSFAFLLATLTFKYWIRHMIKSTVKSFDLYMFWLFTSALLYTHYYGLFFIFILVFIDLIKNGYSKKLLCYLIPFFVFLPWGLVIKQQLGYHVVHWTDGSFSFISSLKAFGLNIFTLLFSPMSDIKLVELFFGILTTVTLIFFSKKSWKEILFFFSVLFVYFIQIFIFDNLFDKHTVIVSRYYIFILIFIYWSIAVSLKKINKFLSVFLVIVYCLISSTIIYDLYSSSRAPKQMYRELAWYIEAHYDPINTLIVVEHKETMVWALAYYFNQDYTIVLASDKHKITDVNRKIIYIDECLGDNFRENNYNKNEKSKLNKIVFVGINLYE